MASEHKGGAAPSSSQLGGWEQAGTRPGACARPLPTHHDGLELRVRGDKFIGVKVMHGWDRSCGRDPTEGEHARRPSINKLTLS